MHKIILVIVTALMTIHSTQADEGVGTETVDGVQYTYIINDGGETVRIGPPWYDSHSCGIPTNTTGKLAIPRTLGGRLVTGIGDRAFYNCNVLTDVIVPDGVTSIEKDAFYGCSSIKSIVMPAGVTYISSAALSGCVNLESLTIPGAFKLSDIFSWEIPQGLREVTITEGSPLIAEGMFSGCNSVDTITVPNSVTAIGNDAFSGCGSLVSVCLPENITTIGSGAFSGCTNLRFFDFPAKVTSINDYTFVGCEALAAIALPQGLTLVKHEAFRGCGSIASVSIPSTIQWIASDAFIGCSSIRDIQIPIGIDARTIFADSQRTIQKIHLVGNSGEVPDSAYAQFESLSQIDIDEGVTSIGSDAFKNCKNLLTIEIPQSITHIGNFAFSGCAGLKEVSFKGDAPDIGDGIFEGTPKRLIVSVPNGSIGWGTGISTDLPETWGNRLIVHSADSVSWPGSNEGPAIAHYITITNIVLHCIMNSIQPSFARPVIAETGFVNVITEIKGSNISVPQSWTQNYPSFEAKFGEDFTKAIVKKSGKISFDGREMLVWEDYVAGTDPTNPDDKFSASIMIVDGKPVVSYTPELDEDRKALRQYTVYGKRSLRDASWDVVEDGAEEMYNFFKVTVEMKP